ncbi:MAG TPA: T9SS type A sorting domain-containing protein [Bacteroidia bacterium]|jgi:hypothetical protein|nr:T9SS type A sorting domain-containing protein [Bacteroidia bacterium]
MKKIICLLLFVITISSNAQITLDNTYNSYFNAGINNTGFTVVNLSNSGYKYVNPFLRNGNIILYNLNHTIFKTLTYPPIPSGGGDLLYFISETLFDNNPSNVEFLINRQTNNGNSSVYVFEENGAQLFFKDSVYIAGTNPGMYPSPTTSLFYTTSGVKLLLTALASDSVYVYNLPGSLVCSDCTNSITSSRTENNNLQNNGITNYPNPAKNETTVAYDLPPGVTSADLVFYNITGQEVKRFKVSNAFKDILISTSDLEAGTYYYQLQASGVNSAGKKMIIIK